MNKTYDPNSLNVVEFLIDIYSSMLNLNYDIETYADEDFSDEVYQEVVNRLFGENEVPVSLKSKLVEEVKVKKQLNPVREEVEVQLVSDMPLYKQFSPSKIVEYLDKYVIGQSAAKKALSIALYNHLKRMEDPKSAEIIGKSNVFIIGDTGVGKTFLLRKLSEICHVPLIIEDASALTEEGYVGRSVSDMVKTIATSGENAEFAIVFLDEIDKLSCKNNDRGGVGTKAVQDNLLKVIEGGDYEYSTRTSSGYKISGKFNTKNVLFIAGGSFSGIDKVIEKRELKSRNTTSIGFGATLLDDNKVSLEKAFKTVIRDDLVDSGMSREFMGRMHHITRLHPLKEEDLLKILKTGKESALTMFKKRLEMDNVSLSFTEPALKEIAARAIKNNTGARGLLSIMEELMTDIQFNAPEYEGKEFKITKEYVLKILDHH